MNCAKTRITKECPQCGSCLFADMTKLLTTNPPQYEIRCNNCDYVGYQFCDRVEPWTPEPARKNKAKAGCIVPTLGCLTLLLVMFTFWGCIQFIKLCNWLIECGW